jgi:hypothetical protein
VSKHSGPLALALTAMYVLFATHDIACVFTVLNCAYIAIAGVFPAYSELR